MGFFKYTELHIRNSSSELYTGRCSVICITVKVRITFSHCKIIGIIKKKKSGHFLHTKCTLVTGVLFL